MMRISRLSGRGVLLAAILVAASCGGNSPLSPGISSPLTSSGAGGLRSAVPVASVDATFPLVSGSFSMANEKGDGLVGSYSGTVNYPDGVTQSSTLTFHISDGSGVFAGASGTLALRGTGAFVDEGAFVLDGRGEVTIGNRRTGLILSLRGTSTAGCSATNRIAILQTAIGSMARAGRVTATMSHAVENTDCSS